MRNGIVWNGTVFVYLTELFEIELFLILKFYLCLAELFEIELFICVKMDLALGNQQRLIGHKPK